MRDLQYITIDTGLLSQLRHLEKKWGAHKALSMYVRLMIECSLCSHTICAEEDVDRETLMRELCIRKPEKLTAFLTDCARYNLIDNCEWQLHSIVQVPDVEFARRRRDHLSQVRTAAVNKRWEKERQIKAEAIIVPSGQQPYTQEELQRLGL